MAANLESLLQADRAWDAGVSELLTALRQWIGETAPLCLRHPHGFYVLPLKLIDEEEWRLHLWPNGNREIKGMPARIHTHDRHIDSRILLGGLTNICYDAHAADVDGKPVYTVAYHGDKYQKTTTNRLQRSAETLHLEEVTRRVLVAGECYRIERHTFHEAQVSEALTTCTLIRMHSYEPGAIRVVGIEGYPDEVAFEREQFEGKLFLHFI
ncbi:hypothetical protein [Pseudomonas sp. Y24-6]|uniref:hypothetical protein n=1 Tax=Pseudomonas sp. Y24-6 TaxID=2750013 RepID=UPI001CE125C5|nr:hypothetical protein [Pseudomonas sp. Y24-6]MCA4964083.1 hypothetical protein [Pseudomonas sp. Y24-6]